MEYKYFGRQYIVMVNCQDGNVSGALHGFQVAILKFLYDKKLTIFRISERISKEMNIECGDVKFHVSRLVKMGYLQRGENPAGKGYVYTVDRKRVRLESSGKKDVLWFS